MSKSIWDQLERVEGDPIKNTDNTHVMEITRRISLIDSLGFEFDVSRRRDTDPDFSDYVNVVIWGIDEDGEVHECGNFNFKLDENLSDHSYCDAAVAQMEHIEGVGNE